MPDPADVDAARLALDTRADARNRGLRTALQAFLVAVVVDLVPILSAAFEDEAVDWGTVGKAALRVVLAAVLAVAMRYAAPPPAPEA